MLNIEFQFYPARVDSKKPLGTCTLAEFLKGNQDPNDKIKRIFRLVALCEKYGDMRRKAILKQNNLYYFTPCIVSDGLGRGYANIARFTGLLVLDFDHIDNANEFKYYLFNTLPSIVAAWLSPSKRGVKFLVKIPVVTSVDEFKAYFYGLGNMFEKFKGWDGSPQNCVLPLFLSYDPDLLYRADAELWTQKGIKIDEFKASDQPIVKVEVTGDGEKEQVKRIILHLVNMITDNGHPQIRAAAVTLGGYVASGYIDLFEAESFISSLIQNNLYLSKGVAGYIKTAKSAINLGTKSQLFLSTNT